MYGRVFRRDSSVSVVTRQCIVRPRIHGSVAGTDSYSFRLLGRTELGARTAIYLIVIQWLSPTLEKAGGRGETNN